MPQIRRGTLIQVLGPAGEGINNSVRGIISLGSTRIEAHVKFVDAREILVECVCALLARQLDLDSPEPILVLANAAHSPTGQERLAYGSASVAHGNLRPWIAKLGDPAVKRRLKAWADLIPAGCFDEWVANFDRHEGNILYDGADKFWLIDHGLAVAPNLQPNAAVNNKFFRIAVDGCAEAELLKIKPQALSVMDTYKDEEVGHVFSQIPDDIWGDEDSGPISDWLRARQSHLHPLVDSKIQTQQGALLNGGANA